jgi:hypothetical protein
VLPKSLSAEEEAIYESLKSLANDENEKIKQKVSA